jgi:tetratricopeptide (TPR) repeat protein
MIIVKKHIAKSIGFFICINLLIALPLYSQKDKNVDSIIRASTKEMYINPDKAIGIGNAILNESGNNIDSKIKGYKLISDAYSSKRDYEKSLEYTMKANQLLDKTNNELLKINIINKIGIQYHQLKIFDKSIFYLDQAEQLIRNYPIQDSIYTYLGSNYIVRGFIYKEKFNCEIAIDFFDKGIDVLLKSKSNSAFSAISIAKYNKGNCYILMLNNDLAIDNFKQSYQFAKKVDALSLEGFALKGLAQVFTLEGKFSDAIPILQNALLISSKVNDLILNQELYKGLSENYLALNEWDNFKKYHFLYLNTQKLIKERERKSVCESLNMKETELSANIKKENFNFNLFVSASIIIFIFFSFFCFLFFRNKVQIVKKLKEQINSLQSLK